MGKRLIIPGITSFTGPKIYADPIMSKGSLLLWDPTHPEGGDTSGVTSGAPLTNIAADIAAPILGVSEASAHPLIYNYAPASNAIPSLKQRSGKGGLYGLYSHSTGGTGVAPGLGVNAQTLLRQYLFDNSLHAFFVSVWARSLRRAIQGSQNAPMPLGQFARANSPSGSALFNLNGGAPANTLGSRQPGNTVYNALWDTDLPRIVNLGRQGWQGTPSELEKPATSSLCMGPLFTNGSAFGYTGANLPGLSSIIERVYIEDLTVSGRTYAEVDAIDFALFNTAHAAGGAWFGDTYPDPATLP